MSTYDAVIEFQEFVKDYTGKADSRQFVDSRILQANAAIAGAGKSLESIVTSLQSQITDCEGDDPFSNFKGVDDFDVDDPDFNKSNITGKTSPTLPSQLASLSFNVDSPVFNPQNWTPQTGLDSLPDRPDLLGSGADELNNLEPPDSSLISDPPEGSITYSPSGYTSGLLDFLSQSIQESIEAENNVELVNVESNVALDGNTSDIKLVDDSIEQAIYDRARSRMRDEEAKQVADAEAQMQSRGFSVPPGMLAASINEVRRAALKAAEDLENDITQKRINLEQKRTEYELQRADQITDAQYKHDSIIAQLESLNIDYLKAIAQNKGVFIDSAARIEAAQAEIYKTEETLKLEAEKETLNSILAVYNARIDGYKKLVDAYVAEAGAVQAKIRAVTDYNQGLISIYGAEIEASKAALDIEKTTVEGTKILNDAESTRVISEIESMKSENERLKAIADTYNSEVMAYAAKIDGLKAAELADVERYKSEAAGEASKITAQAQVATAQVESAMKKMAIDVEILKAQAQSSTSIISSALNSINTSTSFGFSGSTSRSGRNSTNFNKRIGYSYTGSVTEDVTPTELRADSV